MSLKLELNKVASSVHSQISPLDLDGFVKTINSPDIGFFRLPTEFGEMEKCKKLHQRFISKRKFFHVGIGGSALGTEVLAKAFPNQDCDIIFLNNVDPDDIQFKLSLISSVKDCLFYVVSKSGGTAETNAAFAIIVNLLQQSGIEEDQFKDYFVFCTDPVKSELRTIAAEYSIECLTIPVNVGGRFSVLTSVGFFPALFLGIDTDQLMNGAKEQAKLISQGLHNKNSPLNILATAILNHQKEGINQTILMPYSSLLRDLSFWFVQLWAESLGKKHSTNHRVVNTGLTPVPAYGPTDQHSQVQLFMEGPYDKFIIFIEVETFSNQLSLNNNFKTSSLQKLAPFSLGQLLKAELEGTCQALTEEGRAWAKISIPKLNPHCLGELFIFLESLTALVGISMEINPFDQPGVEAGKVYAFKWLSN